MCMCMKFCIESKRVLLLSKKKRDWFLVGKGTCYVCDERKGWLWGWVVCVGTKLKFLPFTITFNIA